MSKPIILSSSCLGFSACRYNGECLKNPFIHSLKKYVTIIPICPEESIDLGTPRKPVRIETKGESRNLIQPATGKNLTARMNRFSREYLNELPEVHGFILKAKSPSCGIRDTKLYSENGTKLIGKGSGLFASAVLERFKLSAIEDEARLANPSIREHFLIRVFTTARSREVMKKNTLASLVQFHTDNKLLLQAHSKKARTKLDQIVANHTNVCLEELFDLYDKTLRQTLTRTPRYRSHIKILEESFGIIRIKLDKRQQRRFVSMLEKYQDKQLPLCSLREQMREWIAQFDITALKRQTYFSPYPAELFQTTGR